jgi:hypothetical protein
MSSDLQQPSTLAAARQEIAILRACRDVNIVQFVVRCPARQNAMRVSQKERLAARVPSKTNCPFHPGHAGRQPDL